jgi:hypothetical protein
MRYWLAITLSLCLAGLPLGETLAQWTDPATPQEQDLSEIDPIFLLWGRNIARRAAEAENGGLANYMAEPAMHGPTTQAPLVINPDGSLTFTFKGYRPEDIDAQGTPTFSFETEVLVNPDRTFEVVYNGPIRPLVQ